MLLSSPDGKQLLWVELRGLNVTSLGQRRPFLIARCAASGAVEVRDVVRVHLDFAAFALDDDGVVTEQCAGLAMSVLITGVEDALQPAARAQWVEQACQRMHWGAQAEQVAHVDHALQHGHPGAQRDEREIALVQRSAYLLPTVAVTDAQ